MLFTNTLTIAATSFVLVLGTQNPAVALVNPSISAIELVSSTTKVQTPKQPILIAENDTYWGPNRDFKILMPGKIVTNTDDQLISVSATESVYMVIHRNFPQASRIPIPQLRQVLQSAMRESIGLDGKIIQTTNLVINQHPGLELVMQHSDGTLGQYRIFVVNQRVYFMGTVTTDELTTESVNFFDSFRVYPENITYSNWDVY
ncbi:MULTISPECIES: hypothetical protein [Cyanophyceae]|uniref:hypothetical protein n=1 Tax=Cyanophyceae TaxID=3028117 RepID=UPI00232C92EF|nr:MULTISPECIES: hypothetical protein [Cyanophyceae]MDB9356557.1 hypothetical protein [Nodularia spumigena CS-587/03]MDB9304406.1 hypothetical protein [Nodularia spumigena CS-591/12]MDB9318939.1 hypothetical protein [Nodularia spumigena CS-590/01A]MDB9322174.1 hypothetical protein [Nodularia spumigena CS-591/07A]MDB9326717.1 hypothetical protein [Nodularia spumigena CS-590/02]